MMEQKVTFVQANELDSNHPWKLAGIGFAVGMVFPIIGIVLDLYARDLSFTSQHVAKLYGETPSHFIALLAPLSLGLVMYYIGKETIVKRLQFIASQQEDQQQWEILTNFISSLDKGDLAANVDENFKNEEVLSLLTNYKENLIREKRQDEIRAWESNGMAQFSELLRSTNDVSKLSDDVISFIVKYTKSNQGSLFILKSSESEEDALLELKSVYAYNRKKYETAFVEPGQGLVGQCYLEQNTIRLRQVPQGYVKITSGLGEATPTSVVIVPLKSSEKVYGVLELASFNNHEDYVIKFLENICEALGSTLQTLNTNNHVKNLLESSQEQTEQLRSQEEEMRQNMEEIQAIQEQLARQLEENIAVKEQLEARENVLGLTTILSESDLYGTITFINEKFCKVSGFSRDELIGKPHNIVRHPDTPKAIFKLMWSTIKQGDVFKGIIKNRKKNGGYYWVDATIVPIYENGVIVKYIGARYHIEDDTMAEKLYEEQLVRLGIVETV
jgi:PAS domain S-box-containing protein